MDWLGKVLNRVRSGQFVGKNDFKLDLILDVLPALVAYVDHNRRLRYVNRAFEDWIGQKRSDLIGKKINEVLHAQLLERSKPLSDRALKGQFIQTKFTYLSLDGQERESEITYIPDKGPNGQVRGYIVVVFDVTERASQERLYQQETRALEIVGKVGLSLQSELSLRKLIQSVTNSATNLANAEYGAFFFRDLGPDLGTLISTSGISFSEVTATAEISRETSFRVEDAKPGQIPGFPQQTRSYLHIPVKSQTGEAMGALVFGHSKPNMFTERTERLLAGVAAQAAVAIDNARLYQQLKARESVYRQLAEFNSFIAEAGKILNTSLDFAANLENLARYAVPKIMDSFVVHLRGKDLSISPVALQLRTPELTQKALELWKLGPLISSAHGARKVMQTGQVEFTPKVTPEFIREYAEHQQAENLLSEMELASMISVPLKVRGKMIGAMTLQNSVHRRPFNQDDVHLAEELAIRIASSIDNSQLYQEAQAATRLRDEFLATVSHELRTPLSVILGFSELLVDQDLDEEAGEAIAAIHRNAKSQLQIIEDLLDVSAIVTGKFQLKLTSLNLNELVKTVAENLQLTADSKKVYLTFTSEVPSALVMGDATRLQQVIWNLLSNAIKFTPEGGQVTMTLRQIESRCELEVKDTGKGMDKEFLPHVFERFRQEDSSITRTHGGLGLGLAIVRHLVELHGGRVKADSEGPGQGSTFTVTLPMQK